MLGLRPESLLAELHRLEAQHDPHTSTEQRHFKRFAVRGDAELHPMSRSRLDREPIEVKLRDIGRGGVGFISSEPLPTESNWRMCFLHHGYVIGEQAIFVRYCRPISRGLYLVGGQFVADTGLLTLLGIDPGAIVDDDSIDVDSDDTHFGFVPPGEVG